VTPSYAALAALIRDRATTTPLLVGIAGPVAVGKTTIVRALAAELERHGRDVQVLSTDAFLLSNEALNARGLLMRKGFPESYDAAAIAGALGALRAGTAAEVRIYSHEIYDILPEAGETIAPRDVILVEGIVALQPPTVDHLDLAVYVDAPEAVVREWFVDRFARLTAAAIDDAASFYHPFAALPPEQVRQIAEATWETINGPNLRDHIAPSAARADVVVRKAADHSLAELRVVNPS
jgi:type I pantothenate kinase